MTLPEYKSFADELAKEAGVENGLHGYFLAFRERLWQTASHFDIWNLRGKKILEIGPFFSYTPFALAKQGNDVSVVEGSDPVVIPLKALYQKRHIEFIVCDLFETFGASRADKHRLPFDDNQFDIVSCWETMEHFNFNPVGFVRDLHRVLKPGGRAFLTVPNMARLEGRAKLFFGKGIANPIQSYNQFYNYSERFLGFHWREYVMPEFTELFRTQNFSIVSAAHLLAFTTNPNLSFVKKMKRLTGKIIFTAIPSTGTICVITAKK